MTYPSHASPVEQVDLLLATWDERLRRMDENLVALESEAIYQILAGKAGKRPALEGATKAQVDPALEAVTELFENRERLVAVITKAKEVREGLSFWGKDEKLDEIRRLLTGPSVELGQKIVALSERSLLDVATRDISIEPEKLLAEMAARFQTCRTALLAVSRAWEAIEPVIGAVEAEMIALRALGAELSGGKDLAELAQAEAELNALRARVAKDPLGAEGAVENAIKPRLAALRARLDAESAARRRVEGALAEAHDLRRHVEDVRGRAAASSAEASREIANASLPPLVDEALIAGLDEWMTKLEATVAAHRWSGAEVGLARWRATAEQYVAADTAAAHAASTALARRGELSGRLSARRAQAAAFAARGLTLDPVYEAWAKQADALLHQRPLPVAEAVKAVETYESGVVALASRRAP